jgi:ligand-binding sensor domain-containing protein/signal transduction histidine kinase
MKKTWFFLLLLLFTLCSATLSFSQAHLFKNYTVEDGLLLGQVRKAAQDCFGRIWIVSENGLNYMEDNEWHTFYLPSEFSKAVYYGMYWDSKCNLWASSNLGLIKYDGRKFKLHRYFAADVKNIVNAFYEYSDSTIWAAYEEGGISFITNGKAHHFKKKEGFTDSRVTEICKTPGNRYLFSTIDDGLYEYDEKAFKRIVIRPDSFQTVTFEPGNCVVQKKASHPDRRFPKRIRRMLYDKEGTVWLVESGKLYSWNGKNLTFYCFGADRIFLDMEQDPSGKLLIATDIGMFVASEDKIEFLGEKSGLVNDQVYDILVDREKVLWIATYGKGLFRSLGNHFSSLSVSPLVQSKSFTAVLRDKNGDLLAGTSDKGMYVISGENIRNYNSYNSALPDKINALVKDNQGNTFIATGKGVYKYDGTFKKIDDGCRDCFDNVLTMALDPQGKLWFASPRGVYSYKHKLKKEIETKRLSHRVIYNLMFASDSTLYIGTFLGLDLYKKGVVSRSGNKVFRESQVVGMVEESPGLIWFSLKNAGLLRWQKNTNDFLYIGRRDGLQSDFIHTLNFDKHKNVFAASSAGLDKISFTGGKEWEITSFNRQQGFYGVTPSFYNSFFEDSELLYGTAKGILRYNHLPVSAAKLSVPPFVFREIKVNGKHLELDTVADYISALNTAKPELSYKENNLAFTLSVNSTQSQQLYTRFQLAGFDKEWSAAAKLSEISYTNLPPGKYELNIAFSPTGKIWSDPFRYHFTILSPFWKQWWFYGLVVLTAILLARAVHLLMLRRKIRKVMEKERYKKELLDGMRKKMAMDFHDDLGNQLASLRIYANMISIQLKNKTPELSKLLWNIESSSDKLFQGTKDFIWSINPKSDSLFEIYTYLKDFGEELFSKVDISFYANFAVPSEDLPLPSGWSRHIVLIFKEAMTNTLKHAATASATLAFRMHDAHIEIAFTDKGKGIPENSKAGKGLRNMEKRAAAINAVLHIDAPDKGVRVRLELTVPSNPAYYE